VHNIIGESGTGERLANLNPAKVFTILEAKESVVGNVKVEAFKRTIPYQPAIHGKLY